MGQWTGSLDPEPKPGFQRYTHKNSQRYKTTTKCSIQWVQKWLQRDKNITQARCRKMKRHATWPQEIKVMKFNTTNMQND